MNFLIWLDESPWRFWTLCGFIYAFVLALCFSPDADRHFPRLLKERWLKRLQSDAAFLLALAAMLFAFRWPVFFYPHHLNPDESGYIATTLTLHHDPIFWRSATAGTSGPLNIYPRMLPGLFGMADTFFISRVMALFIVISCLAVFHSTCRKFASSTFARLATLAPATFFALTTSGDFTHYSGELMPMLLLAIASYLALRLSDSVKRTSELSFITGCLLGALPFAKLQASVLGVCIAVFCYVFLLGRKESWKQRGKRCAWLTLGGGTAPVIMVLLAFMSGCFEHFWQSYLVMNLGYTANGGSWTQILSAVPGLLVFSMLDFSVYSLGIIVAGMRGLVWIAVSGRWRNLNAAELRLLVFTSVMMAVSIFTALAPGRPFPHYFLFMVLPLAGWAFATINVTLRESSGEPRSHQVTKLILPYWCIVALAGQFIALMMLRHPLELRGLQPMELRGHVGEFVKVPRSEVAEAILKHTSPGQPLGLWGWMYEFHVETGTWRATRDHVLEYLLNTNTEVRQASNWRDLVPIYFQNLYVEDFKRSKPPVFVDAVAPGSFVFEDHQKFGHETFPALANYVNDNYRLAHEIGGIRIFVRKDTHGVIPTGSEKSRTGSTGEGR